MKKILNNRINLIAFIGLLVFIFNSCAKEGDPEFLDALLFRNQETGTVLIYISNDITNTVEIYVDDEYKGELLAKLEGDPNLNTDPEKCLSLMLSEGKHTVEAKCNNETVISKRITVVKNSVLTVPFEVICGNTQESDFVKDIDGNSYDIIRIGNQWWMAENFKTTTYNDGTTIPNVSNDSEWKFLNTPAYCWYDNNISNKETYGALYNWYTVNTNKLCPEGWHIPTNEEWLILINYLGGSDLAGGKLKETGTTHWKSPNTGATNSSGFTALPGGYRDDFFKSLGEGARFWSATESSANTATIKSLGYGHEVIASGQFYKNNGFSIRCIKNTDQGTTPTVTTSTVSNITQTTATCGGNISEDGGTVVTERGIYYGTLTNPENNGTKVQVGSGEGSFTTSITDLTVGTTYYIIAYATNSTGTSYGTELSFSTSSSINTPTLTTTGVSSVTNNSAISGGNITSNGGSEVIARGICWSTSQNPTITDSHSTDGTGIGSFASNIIDLTVGTRYYVRAYASNAVGTSYGDEISFSTTELITLPSLNTDGISNITYTMAKSGGNITSDGGASVTQRGVCWSTSTNPTIADNYTNDGNGINAFESYLNELTAGTTYYIRAYATNSLGTAYGDELNFTTINIETGTVSDIDGNVYKTVKMGDQWWMAENLKVTHYHNGTAIPLVTDNTLWGNLDDNNTDDAYCNYNNTVNEYGSLYTWAAAMGDNASSSSANPSGIQGACPSGWHMPSDAEWTELVDFVGDNGHSGIEGAALKAISGWNSSSGNGTDNYGFTILPGGVRDDGNGTYNNVTYLGIFWSTTEIYGTNAYTRNFVYSNVFRDNFYKSYGHSVRCVKD